MSRRAGRHLSNSLRLSLVYKKKKRYSNKEKLRDIEVTGRTLLAHFHYIYGRFRFFSSDSRDWPTNSRVIEIDDAAKDLILSIRGIIPEVGGYKTMNYDTEIH